MFKKSLLAAILSFASISAFAEAVDLNFVSTNTTVSTQVSVNGSNLNTAIGSYNLLTAGAPSSVIGFCVDPYQWASTAITTYEKSALDASDFFSGNGDTRLLNAQKLFDNAYASLSGAEQTAGFHLALWEIFHDDLSTTTGSILATTSSDAGMLAAANTFLGALSGWNTTNAFDLTFFGSATHQDYLVANPSAVPVPAALPLFASGLLGFGAMRRRNKAKA